MVTRIVVCYFKPGAISHYACVPADTLQHLANSGFYLIYCETSEDFFKYLPQAEITLVAEFKAEWIELAPKLKWVATFAAGKERIAEAALVKKGVKVTFGRFHGRIMAETLIGMMLFVSRRLGTSYRLQSRHEWWDTELFDQVSLLRGKTCMILGFGNIGQYVARLTKVFGMFNIGVKRNTEGVYQDIDKLITFDSLKFFLPKADYLVIILPNDPATDNLIGAAQLSLLKPTASLYNLGRGNCIDEEALYTSLIEKRLAWACLDVFQREPLPMDSPLRTLENVLILPHASAFAPEYFQYFFEEFYRDFEEFIKNN